MDVPADDLPREGLLDRVRAVTPMITARSFEAEALRRPLDEVIDALKATGVFRAFVARRHGGYELDLGTFVDVGLAVAHADPSMGWVTTFYMEHNWLLTALFSDELQEEVFGSQPYVLAPGSVNPSGRAVPVEGGWSLSGRWQFGTGICHADWVLVSGRVDGEDAPRTFLLPRDEVEVKDTWHVDGMAATGSRDLIVSDAFVPTHRASLPVPPAAVAGPDAPYLVRIPLPPMLSLTAALPALGAAQRAVELFEGRLTRRIVFGTGKPQAVRVPTQVRLANLLAEVDEAEMLIRAIADRMQAHAEGRTALGSVEQLQLRLSIAHVVRRCRDVVRDVVEASGASVHHLDHELQRIHRDIHMICAHTVFDVDLVAEGIGKALVKRREGASA